MYQIFLIFTKSILNKNLKYFCIRFLALKIFIHYNIISFLDIYVENFAKEILVNYY